MLAVVYLVFNEGYAASAGDALVRDDLCAEAIRLGRLLAELMPDEPEVIGLLALMLLTAARRPARVSPAGDLVPLADQDRFAGGTRRSWPRARTSSGGACGGDGPGRTRSRRRSTPCTPTPPTDWRQVLALYDQLLTIAPSPVVALNRAVAVAEIGRAGGRRSPSSTRSTWTATTCSTPSAPTCCAASAARRRPTRRTGGPPTWPATPPNAPTCAAG